MSWDPWKFDGSQMFFMVLDRISYYAIVWNMFGLDKSTSNICLSLSLSIYIYAYMHIIINVSHTHTYIHMNTWGFLEMGDPQNHRHQY